MVLGVGSPAAYAQAKAYAERTLHTFTGSGDGLIPDGALLNVNGLLYGTTGVGGTHSFGTVFSINPDGTGYKTLYSFGTNGTSDGANPTAGLVLLNGLLYGTTRSSCDSHYGSVYAFDPASGKEKVVCSFDGSTGGNPATNLISVNGLLYGTTSTMGANDQGAIFSVDPATSTLKTLYSFAGNNDGDLSYGALVNVNGILYGTTFFGGSADDGVVYSYDLSNGQEKVLHTFTGAMNDGNGCRSGLLNVDGVLYGTTLTGGAHDSGTVFSYTIANNAFRVVYSFTGSSGDGSHPNASLIDDSGILYGTTYAGGNANSGTVFAIDPNTNKETILYRFTARDMNEDNADGAEPYANLLSINGALYGTAEDGGIDGGGTLFSLTPIYPPTAKDDNGHGFANHTLVISAPGVLGNDNLGGDPNTTAAVAANPAHGTLTLNSDGSFTYTPTTDYVGTDRFTYQDTNAAGTSNVATCTLTTQATVPTAKDDANTFKYNTPLIINAPGVLKDDNTGGSSPLTATLVTGTAHGTVTLSSNGGYKYIPNTGYLGNDSFTYQAANPIGKGNIATVTLSVQPTVPTANNDHGTGYYKTTLVISAPGVLGNDSNGGKGPLTALLVSSPVHGILTFHTDGSFTYVPNTGYVGTDSFTYQASNSVGKSNTATVTLTIKAKAPTAVNNSNNVKKNTTLTVPAPGVLGNDDDGGSSPMTAVLVTNVSHGTLTLNNNGAFTYTPNTGFTGTDSFTYQAVNSVGKSNIATATLIVQ